MTNPFYPIHIMEDHDDALNVWKKNNVKNVDLVHVDAHIDFGIHQAKSLENILEEAKSVEEVKRSLEISLTFSRYEHNLDAQTHIGNYIYPAIKEDIIKDFYWIVPGTLMDFEAAVKLVKGMLGNLLKQAGERSAVRVRREGGKVRSITTRFGEHRMFVCTLDALSPQEQITLLDIDMDFLIIPNLFEVGRTHRIKSQKPWISPENFVRKIQEKIKNPEIVTIAYSVNGGYTPIVYKHLGDEIAYRLDPERQQKDYQTKSQAACYYSQFLATNKKEFYQKAVQLDPSYRAPDNSYGPVYLSMRKYGLAEKEFTSIWKVDKKNPACLQGLGEIALARKNYSRARQMFIQARMADSDPIFKKVRQQAILGLAKAEIALKNDLEAERLLGQYREKVPLDGECYYLRCGKLALLLL